MNDIIITRWWCITKIALPIWVNVGLDAISVTEAGVTLPAVLDDEHDGWGIFVLLKGDKPEKFKHLFRLLDDDGDVYAYGWSSDNESELAFDPLDWAASQWGCTSIEYWDGEDWETL